MLREEPRSCQFNRWQPREILWARGCDGIACVHVFNPNRVFIAVFRAETGSFVLVRSRLLRARYATYEPTSSANATTAGVQALGGSPTDRCEYNAPVTSNVSPAKAHSL